MPRTRLSREPTDALVDGFTHGGEGVVRIEGKAVFVPGAIPGERVRVRVVDDRKNWARAELLEVLDASPDRVEPPCPYVPDCGGCDLQHVAPDGQRRLKRRVVVEQLERLGRLSDPPVEACRTVGPDTGYRTHAQLHAADDGRLGFHRAGSHDVVPVEHCLVLAPATQRVRDTVGDGTRAAEVQVRAHATTGTAAAVLHPDPDAPLEMPADDGATDVVLAQPDGSTMAFRGDGVLAERVADSTFHFDAAAFFQVNTGGAQAIVDEVLAAAGDLDGAVAWDLYAGVGLLTVPLARGGAEVVAVEGDEGSARWLAQNADDNDVLDRVQPVADDVAAFVADDHDDSPDVVVLDPPRTGAGPDTCARLAELRPDTIVYVACDPAALARDARALAEHGYTLRRAVPLDLFPMTHHVEVVATFTV
jgi:tRNA/tmRNA/rRNA uracil-C5-methylase (TrmA/RlmC/RlmD family)